MEGLADPKRVKDLEGDFPVPFPAALVTLLGHCCLGRREQRSPKMEVGLLTGPPSSPEVAYLLVAI